MTSESGKIGPHKYAQTLALTCIVEERVQDGAVLEESPDWSDVLEETVLEDGIFKGDRLELHTDEPEDKLMIKKKK